MAREAASQVSRFDIQGAYPVNFHPLPLPNFDAGSICVMQYQKIDEANEDIRVNVFFNYPRFRLPGKIFEHFEIRMPKTLLIPELGLL